MSRSALRAAAALLVAAFAAAGAALALDGDRTPEDEKRAKDAEAAAVKEGEKLFRDEAIGTNDRSCSTCHDSPKRPDLSLKGVTTRFPRYDDDAGRVITLQEKFMQMHERSLKSRKPFPLGDRRWTALEIYLKGLK